MQIKLSYTPLRSIRDLKEDQPKKCLQNLTRGDFRGFISKGSAKTIRTKTRNHGIKGIYTNRKQLFWTNSSLNIPMLFFITLTLPSDQCDSDNEIKRSVLMPFIQQLKRVSGVDQYFWSCEPQENGNLHFHCLIDRYVRKELLTDLWNVACNHLGYLDRYIERTGSTSPPSTQNSGLPSRYVIG